MENNISNEEQIRNKFERIFQYENNKNAFLDSFYGRSNSCPTLRNYYGYEAEDIFKFVKICFLILLFVEALPPQFFL